MQSTFETTRQDRSCSQLEQLKLLTWHSLPAHCSLPTKGRPTLGVCSHWAQPLAHCQATMALPHIEAGSLDMGTSNCITDTTSCGLHRSTLSRTYVAICITDLLSDTMSWHTSLSCETLAAGFLHHSLLKVIRAPCIPWNRCGILPSSPRSSAWRWSQTMSSGHIW